MEWTLFVIPMLHLLTPYLTFERKKGDDIIFSSETLQTTHAHIIEHFVALYVSFQSLRLMQNIIITLMLHAYFLKRIVEILFVHSYSNENRGVIETSCKSIMFASYVTVITNSRSNNDHPMVGFIVYLCGMIGNTIWHLKLRDLRQSQPLSHARPTDWLSQRIVCPHYSFECLIWIGIAITKNNVYTGIIAYAITHHLYWRAFRTVTLYVSLFHEHEEAELRKRLLIPYLL